MSLSTRAAFVLLSVGASAADPPPEAPTAERAIAHMGSPIGGARMGAWHLTFENSTLADVLQRAAEPIKHRADAGESLYWVCYTIQSPAADQSPAAERVWILSDGEMGGPEHRVTGIIAKRLTAARSVPGCPALPPALLPIALDNGVWLGSTLEEAAAAVGGAAALAGRAGADGPSQANPSWHTFRYAGKLPSASCSGGFDVTNEVSLQSEDGRVSALQAGQVTSC